MNLSAKNYCLPLFLCRHSVGSTNKISYNHLHILGVASQNVSFHIHPGPVLLCFKGRIWLAAVGNKRIFFFFWCFAKWSLVCHVLAIHIMIQWFDISIVLTFTSWNQIFKTHFKTDTTFLQKNPAECDQIKYIIKQSSFE